MVNHRIDMYRYASELEKIKAKPKKETCILFYGSSTFALWSDIERVFENAINAGFGGSTSDEALYHYEEVAKPFNAQVLVWYFGDNEPVCEYSVEDTIECYQKTFECFRKDNPNIKIITIGTKSSPTRRQYKEFVDKLNEWQKKYAAEHKDVTYIDTYDLCFDESGEYIKDSFLADQLHFSKKSYDIIEKRIKNVLKSYEKN